MKITIEYFGSHARNAGVVPGIGIQRTFSMPCNVGNLLKDIGIKEDTVIISVNNVIRNIHHPLYDGDSVSVFDIMEGG